MSLDIEEVAFDPATREAIINIQMAIKRIALVWESTGHDDLPDAQADLEQAVRFLTGEEVPS